MVDLNADGVQEVFVQWGNACTSGLTGRSLSLFIKDSSGSYQPQFGFPAFGWTRLDSESHGWPDLSFGGPGFCRPRWTWQRDAYEFKCNLPQIDGGCEFQVNVC